jgi:hypothetical protein
MAHSKPSQPPLGWEKLIYTNDENEACVDLIVDEVKVHYAIPDLVSLVYHGPRPINHVSRVIDTSKPSTPDNVGRISKDAAVPDPRDGLTTKKITRRVIRPKMSVKFDKLFCLNDDGELYLPGNTTASGRRTSFRIIFRKITGDRGLRKRATPSSSICRSPSVQ